MVWESEDGTARYTHGPDCTKGPNCCCGACNFFTLAVDCSNLVCCKCVPKELCAVHYPYEESEDCISLSTKMVYAGAWNGSIDGIDPAGIDDSIEVLMVKNNYDECFFVLNIPAREISIYYPIDGGKSPCDAYPDDRITCRNPNFSVEDFVLNGCNGRLVIQRKLLEPVPYHSPTVGNNIDSITTSYAPACGQCSEWCNVLCLEWSAGGTPQKSEFRINTSDSSIYWSSLLSDDTTATISAYEAIDGNCYLSINHSGLGDFQDVLIPNGMCNLGMVIEATGDYRWPEKSISISCNRCTCWDYICERCRCVCPTMCVVSVNGTQQSDIVYYELDWDPIALRWGNDDKWVTVRANQTTGRCEFIISGWNDGAYAEYEPSESTIEITECGGDMSYYVTTNTEQAFETMVFRYEYGVCKTCSPDCFRVPCPQCCSECENGTLPENLFLDLRGWPVAAPEDPGIYARRCLEIFDIPLVRTRPLFSVLNVWEGHVIVPCGCPTDPLTDDPSPNVTRIDVTVYCNGSDDWQVGIQMKGPTSSVLGSDSAHKTDPIKTTSFSCNPISWTGLMYNALGFDGNADSCCCSLAPLFDFVISE